MQALSAGENKQQKTKKQEGKQEQNENIVKNVTSARRNATKTHTHTADSHANSYDETEQTFLTEVPGSLGIREQIFKQPWLSLQCSLKMSS